MKALLERAAAGTNADLEEAAQAVLSLQRDGDGVFETKAIEENIYQAGLLIYPTYAKYETKVGKKAGYPDIVSQLAVLKNRLERNYNTMDAARCLMLFTDTLSAMSPEIYEHHRRLNDMLKDMARFFVEKEELCMTQFPEEALKTDVAHKDKEALQLAGQAFVNACEKGFLSEEKFGAMGRCLTIVCVR
ncbi:MAG: hypothetical protein K2G16_11130 [Lachnospiraceae bacterium]|nr:hypothetical protein [Lachnospiraceae bacterium]